MLKLDLEPDRPEQILVGNLSQFDASIEEAFRPVGCTVYLLAEVWVTHYTHDAFLREHTQNGCDRVHSRRPASLVPRDLRP